MSDYIVNKVACDWLTLTTWHESKFVGMVDFLSERLPKGREQKRLQYRGWDYGGIFCGIGQQKGADNYMVQASGAMAQWLLDCMLAPYYYLRPEAWNVTRLDVQLSLCVPDYRLRGWQWVERAKGRRVTHITKEGLDTVYIGSRDGDRFLRIYVKDDLFNDSFAAGDGMGTHAGQIIRWEYELKGLHAKGFFRELIQGGDIQAMWAHLYEITMNGGVGVKAWGDVVCPVLAKAFADIPASGYVREGREPDTLGWLGSSVSSAVVRMLNDHDRRGAMVEILDRWLREAGEAGALERWNI